jgi:hypothetical protein
MIWWTIRKREEEAMTQRDMGNTVLKKKSKKEINKRNYKKIKENEGFMIVKQSEPKQKKKKRK